MATTRQLDARRRSSEAKLDRANARITSANKEIRRLKGLGAK